MKRLAYILTILCAFLAFTSGCEDEKDYSTPDGVWSALDTSSHTSCEVVIGGSNAISSGGVYTRVTITHGPGNYDILLGGLVMTEGGETGVITFSESANGEPNRAFITMVGNKRMVLRFDENSSMSNASYGLAETKHPLSVSGIWAGEEEATDNDATISAVIYPCALNDSYGVITVGYPTLDRSITYSISKFRYNVQSGTGNFIIESTDKDQGIVSYEGVLTYDYEHDILLGNSISNNNGESFRFALSPKMTLDTLD